MLILHNVTCYCVKSLVNYFSVFVNAILINFRTSEPESVELTNLMLGFLDYVPKHN